MKIFFEELYFWTYAYLCKMRSTDRPAFNAYVAISGLQGFNIGTIALCLANLLKVPLEKNSVIAFGLSLILFLYVYNFSALYRKREMIFKKFRHMQPKRKIKGKLLYWAYLVLTFVIFFILGDYIRHSH